VLSFDGEPVLGPLRSREQVLPAVLRRGDTLRRRRRVLLTAPLATALVLASLFALTRTGSRLSERVRTRPGSPPPTSHVDGRGSMLAPSPARTNGAHHAASGVAQAGNRSDRGSTPAPAVPSQPGVAAGRVPSYPHPANCGKWDYDNPHPGWPDCWHTVYGPTGNYSQQPLAQPGARGCVVHNAEVYSPPLGMPQDGHAFFCSYDALRPGGYTTSAPFVIVRIVRNGRTIDVDGHSGPMCEPTGFIQPGDHVYVDGRNGAQYGYTTLSAGDVFHC
jgi:hypothetical protein